DLTNPSLSATTTFHDAAFAGSLSQWGNLATAGWQNGNLNANQSIYYEGQSVPFQMILTGMTTGVTYSVDLQLQFLNSGAHAYDYFSSYYYTNPNGRPSIYTGGTFPNPLTQLGNQIDPIFAGMASQINSSNPFANASTLMFPSDPLMAAAGVGQL